MRILLYTGKGGVGKTSVAAATGLELARRGYRTVVISTDSAHSLGDAFEMTLGSEPTEVAPNLLAHEVDVLHEMRLYWQTVQEWLSALIRWHGMDGIAAEEMAVLPGMEEVMGLLQITRHHREGSCDVVVVDCAPTAETIRLLSFPDMARWYMRKLFPIERRLASAVGPLARGLLHVPIPGSQVFDSVQDLFEQLDAMHGLLTDPSMTSVRLVVNPENMVIKEAQRTYTYLCLYGYHTDLVVCNRVLPDAVSDAFFTRWRASQQRHLQFIEEVFAPVPVWTIPLMDREVMGNDALEEMGRFLYGDANPAQVLYQGKHQEILPDGSGYTLTLLLPFATQGDLSLLQRGEEVVVQVGQYRRPIVLPRMLAGLPINQAKLEGSTLRLHFESPEAPQKAGRRQGRA